MRFTATAERLSGLARRASVFDDPGFRLGGWAAPGTLDDGTMQIGWYDYGASALAFMDDAYRLGWVRDFDWMRWAGSPKGQRLLHAPDLVAAATAVDLSSLLTTVVRGERFSEGEFARAFESGLIQAVVRRAGVLARDQRLA